MKNNVIYLLLILIILPHIICDKLDQRLIVKRNNNNPPSIDNTDYPDYSKYEYTVVPKRAALLFDQLMIALQKVVDNQGRQNIGNSKSLPRAVPLQVGNSQIESSDEQMMDLKRRGQAKSRVYWRCYFNAVTCFKKK
ncbi:PREDICTED: uncharacterized protein LOC106784069 [Polistes canadensis]|uniref:uncharacterized protein LOC106784069 n=1 Tax=Polistes canadensis TaxID=91411 RepID=UPI000718FE99|nr:PREDICTED: uncharacterized protein LOC106784069 [Polistes canadensis]